MKKLLVLALVLGMATMANATISLQATGTSVGIGGNVVISVYNSGSEPGTADFLYYLDITPPGAGIITTGAWTLGPGAGNSGDFPSGVTSDSIIDGYRELALQQAWAIGTAEASGVMGFITVTGVSAGSIAFDLWDDRVGGYVDGMTLSIIPEPMTIALLGDRKSVV